MTTYTTPAGHVFRLVRTEPYTRKDGTIVHLDVWQSPCRRPGCAGHIEVKTPIGSDKSRSSNFRNAHCPEHKMSKEEATAKWVESCLKTTTKATPEVLAKICVLKKEGHSVQKIADTFGLSVSRVYALLAKAK